MTTFIGIIAVVIIIVLRKVNKKIPNALIVVVLGILTIKYLGKYLIGVAIIPIKVVCIFKPEMLFQISSITY